MRHLGPIRSSTPTTSGASHQTQTAPSSVNPSISAKFAALEAERNTIRAVLAPAQRSVQEGGNNISELRRTLRQEVNATGESEQRQTRYYDKSVEASANVMRLEGEAKILKAEARGKPESIARQLLMEAKFKEEEAKREQEKAQENLAKAEDTKREVSGHSRAEGVISQKLDKAITTTSSEQSNVTTLNSQDSAATSNPKTSSSSKLKGESRNAVYASSSRGSSQTSSFTGSQYTVTTQTDSGTFINTVHISTGNSYVDAAMVLLRAIGFHTAQNAQNANTNPVRELALNLTNKGLSEQATTYLEAALVDSTLQGSPINQTIIFLKAQSATLHGEAETNVAYWKEVLNENKQLGKQTHDLAKQA